MRRNGDRAVLGGDRRLGDRGYGALRSGDPVSCLCVPGSGGGPVLTRKINTVTLSGDTSRISGAPQTMTFGPYTWTRVPNATPITVGGQFKPSPSYPSPSAFVAGVDPYQNLGFQVANQFLIWQQNPFESNSWQYTHVQIGNDENAANSFAAQSRDGSVGGVGFGPPINLASGHYENTIPWLGYNFHIVINLAWAFLP